ncbi:MAG: helix-turn-helix transcriptional regulator [Microvirga sp.]
MLPTLVVMTSPSALAASIEEAAFEPDALPAMFEKLSSAVGSELGMIFSLDEGRPEILGSTRAQDLQMAYAAGGWHTQDIATQSIKRLAPGGVRLSHEFMDERMFSRHPFFQDLLNKHGGPYGVGWHCAMGDEQFVFALMRPKAFTQETVQLLEQIRPVANSTMLLATRVLDARARGMADSLEANGAASMLLNEKGHVSYVSRAAEKLLDQDFHIRQGMLWASDPVANLRLGQLFHAARDPLGASSPPQFQVSRRNGRRPIVLVSHRVRGHALDVLPGARLLLTLLDLDARPQPPAALLRAIFNLTPAEAEVAIRLAAGESPQEISDQIGVALSATRQYIKSVMAKTDTHRQAELVALLARLPGGPVDPDGENDR